MNTASSSLDAFDVFVDTAIRKLWKALDKDNLGLVNEDYYIGQLKALDSILSSSSHERKNELHSWELEWRELMRMLHERSSAETTKTVVELRTSKRYISYEDFYNSWLELAKNMTPQDIVPYFNRLIRILKNEDSVQIKNHGSNEKGIKGSLCGKNVYDKGKLSSLTRISGDVFRLDDRGKVRATSRGKMTAQKIFSQWQKRQLFLSSPVTTAKVRTNYARETVNGTPNVRVRVSSKGSSERSLNYNNALSISKAIVKRALLMSHPNTTKGRPESSQTLSLRREKRSIASGMSPNYGRTFRSKTIPQRPMTSPLGKTRPKHTARKNIRYHIRTYSSRSTRDSERENKEQKYSLADNNISFKSGGTSKNSDPTMLRVLKLDGKFRRSLPRPHTAPSSSRKGKIFKVSPRTKRAFSPSPFCNTNCKPIESICPQNYFHVHQLSPRGHSYKAHTQPVKEDYQNRRRMHPRAIKTKRNCEDTELQLYVLQKKHNMRLHNQSDQS
eukprot:g1623.t1